MNQRRTQFPIVETFRLQAVKIITSIEVIRSVDLELQVPDYGDILPPFRTSLRYVLTEQPVRVNF